MSLKENHEAMFMEVLLGGSDGAIERQEARGQNNLVLSEVLPTEMRCNFRGPNEDPKEVLEFWGVEVGKAVDGDGIFTEVKLPEGWKKEATSHSMWSNLVDDKGRCRAAIFYKAAFYDRSAHMDLLARYNVGTLYPESGDKKWDYHICQVKDGDKVVYETPKYHFSAVYNDYDRLNELSAEERRAVVTNYGKASDDARSDATSWANENFPDWQDEKAYWND